MIGQTRGKKPAFVFGGTAVFNIRRARFVVLAIAVVIGSAAVLFPRVGQTAFLSDESGWISSGRHYTNLLWEGDMRRVQWNCPECGGFGDLNMQLGKWLIGIPLALDEESRQEAFFRFYDTKASYEENLERGLVPPHHTLIYARSACAVFGILCCLLTFIIGCYAGNAFVGTVAAALVSLNPLFIGQATRAITDIHYNFFLLCVCLAVVFFSTASKPKRTWIWVVLCGISAGLACSIKITGLVVGSVSFLVAGGQRVWFGQSTKKALIPQLAVFCCSALLVIYGLNPYFWPSPRALYNAAVFSEVKALSSEIIAAKRFPPDVKSRYPHFGTLGWPLQFPRLFLRWNKRMREQERLPSALWHGNRLLVLSRRILLEFVSFRGEFVFLISGVVILFWKRLRRLFFIPDKPGLACLQYFFVNYLFILTFMKVNWDRYYLPTVIAGSLIAAFGLYAIALQTCRFYPMLKRAVLPGRKLQS